MKNYMICQEERPQRNEWMECCWKRKPDPPLFPNLHTRVGCTPDCQTKANQHDELMLSCQLQSRQTIYTKIFAYFFFFNKFIVLYLWPACLSWTPSSPLSSSPRKCNFRDSPSLYIPITRDTFEKWLTFSLTFSNDEGETTEKHTRKTSVCG